MQYYNVFAQFPVSSQLTISHLYSVCLWAKVVFQMVFARENVFLLVQMLQFLVFLMPTYVQTFMFTQETIRKLLEARGFQHVQRLTSSIQDAYQKLTTCLQETSIWCRILPWGGSLYFQFSCFNLNIGLLINYCCTDNGE